ncbi:MAG: hypothetical protein ACLS4Z_03970 [Christensenellaceae bacterium]
MILPDKIIRSRRGTLSISIDPGRLIVRAPLRCGEERICAFCGKKAGSSVERKTKGAGLRLPPESLDGTVFADGKECVIRLYDGTRVRYDENAREVFCAGKFPRALVKWLKENARRILSAICARRASKWALPILPFRHVGKDAVGFLFV